MQVIVAFMALEVGSEFVVFGDVVDFIPDTTNCPPSDIPEFRGGEPEGVEVILHLLLVLDRGSVGAGDDLFRHT
ncbi:hypothetical protein C478_14227 [Natrinema thermotolerans DSM 11552]|nr:hypothetical protein C478_14227 [Natrinema thermotolerans DSM 11552]